MLVLGTLRPFPSVQLNEAENGAQEFFSIEWREILTNQLRISKAELY